MPAIVNEETLTESPNLFQYLQYGKNRLNPIGPVGIISHQVDPAFSDAINFHIRNRRALYLEQYPDLQEHVGYFRSDYRVPVDLSRFNSGEGQATILNSIRGHDLFIISDVLNYGKYYTRFNQTVSLSPDEHYQDLIRLIAATHGIAKRVNVVMPYLYEGRRYRRHNRASLDCAIMLQELFRFGIDNFITFDAHDGRIANAVPDKNFESIPTSEQIIEALLNSFPDLRIDNKHFMVVSPDETTINRCIYYASLMHVPMGIFYRRHHAGVTQPGSTQKSDKLFLGDDIEGRDVLLVDDMIDTGATILECAEQLRAKGAKRIFAAASFAQFSKGFEQVNQAYEAGNITRIFATNLAYRPPVLLGTEWFCDVNLAKYTAQLIDALNHDASLSRLIDPTDRIEQLLKEHQGGINESGH